MEGESKASTLTLAYRGYDSKMVTLLQNIPLFDDATILTPRWATKIEIQLVAVSTLPNIGMYWNLALENDEIKQ